MDNNPQDLNFWNSEDINLLRQFLETRTGLKFLPSLAQSAPTLFSGGDTNKILIRNGQLIGYQDALQNINLLAYPPPAPPVETAAYPPLEKDEFWPQTEKLTQ